MIVYHGTKFKYLENILKRGLNPRGKKDGNWEVNPSRPDMVYLSMAYPFYYGRCCLGEDDRRVVVFEIDTDMLDQHNLYPDEDFIWDVLRRDDKNIKVDEVRDNLENYQDNWKKSIKHLGNCCYHGTILPDCILRYCIVDFGVRSVLEMAIMEPVISILNYKFCKDEYRGYVAWFFGDRSVLPMQDRSYSPNEQEYIDYWEKKSKDRTGIEVVSLS